MKVLVSGSNGNVGKAAVKALLELGSNVEVLAGVRNVEKSQKLAEELKCTLHKFDPTERETLTESFVGVDRVFLSASPTKNRGELSLGAYTAAVKAGVKFICVLSVATSELEDTVFGAQFSPLEKEVSKSDTPHAILRLPMFFENEFGNVATIKGQGQFYAPVGPEKKGTRVAVADIGAAIAAILTDDNVERHNKKVYNIGETVTVKGMAEAWTEVLGKPVSHVQVPPEAARGAMEQMGFVDWQVTGVLELLDLTDKENPKMNPPNDFETITGKKPTSFLQWAKCVAPAFK